MTPYLVFTGWVLAAVLCETTAAAVALAGWSLIRRPRDATSEYAASLTALIAATVLALGTAVALAVWPVAPAYHAIREGLPASAAVASPSLRWTTNVPGMAAWFAREPFPLLDRVAAAVALLWLAGASGLTVRLIGGWFLARRLASRAQPVEDSGIRALASAAAAEAGIDTTVRLLESHEIEAPVVVGWKQAAVILPQTALPRLAAEQTSSLLAHEFAHVRRGDYLVNGLQAAVELLLFFSPGVLWISSRVRETREFCCDDAAVAQCRDRRCYVEALTTLAALGTLNSARAAQGISGPRLITRVRRLLQEEAMPRFSSLRLFSLAIALVLLVVGGLELSAASVSRSPRRHVAFQAGVPYGYATEQSGSGIVIKNLHSSADAPLQSITMQNVTTAPVNAVRVVAAVERTTSSGPLPVKLFVSDEIPVSIAPGGTVDVTPGILTAAQIEALAQEPGVTRVQFFVGLQSVRFANGFGWSITPNPNATAGSDALALPKPSYARALIERDANRGPAANGVCTDSEGRPTTSSGGVVTILNEPGRFMRCDNGRWVETVLK
jgi:beta-lactamase regulating signal transducer with metallopeptidase domain